MEGQPTVQTTIIGFHEVKRPKQMLREAALWMKRVLVEEEPEVLDDEQSCPKELAEDAHLRCLGRMPVVPIPIHDHPGGGHEIGEVVRVVII